MSGTGYQQESSGSFVDLSDYRLPNAVNIIPVYAPLARNSDGVTFDIFDYERLFNDKAVNELIRTGRTIGCFYIESPGMRQLLRRLSVEDFEMLTAASSIIRPGVAESGMMKAFIDRHKDPRLRTYLVPEMEKYLGDTYGVMVYQEDVIKVAHHVAGLTLEEADLLRRAMSGKMRSRETMQRIQDRFFSSCTAQGYSEAIAGELWRQIKSFAGYSFCKAHSASFAVLSYQVAFLKVYYPAEFMASVLSNGGGYYSAAVYVQECKRLGLNVLLPSVNESEFEYGGKGKNVRVGLMAVHNLSGNTIDLIVDERKRNGRYETLAEFLARTGCGYEETATLIRCGAMDCFGETRPTLLRWLDIYKKHPGMIGDETGNLFLHESFKLMERVRCNYDYTVTQRCTIEFETFGYMVTRHPLDFFAGWIEEPGVVKASQMERYHGRRVRMIGWYMAAKRVKTKKGDIMKFLSLEDLTGTFEAVLFPKVYGQVAEKTVSMGPYVVEGRVDAEAGHNLVVDRLEVLTHKAVKADTLWDSTESNYLMDREKITDEELRLAGALGEEKLRTAYAGVG